MSVRLIAATRQAVHSRPRSSISAQRLVTSSARSNTTYPGRRKNGIYDDTVVSVRLDRAALPLFRRLLRQRGAAFLQDVEGWVTEHEKREGPETVRAGVIVQMFVDDERGT